MQSSLPTPPTFTPNDRFIVAGDCPSKGHVYAFSEQQQNWRCVSCQHVAPAGRPAPTTPEPQPLTIPPLTTQPQTPSWRPGGHPGMTPQRVEPMMPAWPGRTTMPFTLEQEFPAEPTHCLFDALPPSERGKPMGLACPCPKHRATC